jgi:hypothetical protein
MAWFQQKELQHDPYSLSSLRKRIYSFEHIATTISFAESSSDNTYTWTGKLACRHFALGVSPETSARFGGGSNFERFKQNKNNGDDVQGV